MKRKKPKNDDSIEDPEAMPDDWDPHELALLIYGRQADEHFHGKREDRTPTTNDDS